MGDRVAIITFAEDGTLNGLADCNNFTGAYSQDNGFNITLVATTMAFCGDESLDQQTLQLLDSVAAGRPDGTGKLALETAGVSSVCYLRTVDPPRNESSIPMLGDKEEMKHCGVYMHPDMLLIHSERCASTGISVSCPPVYRLPRSALFCFSHLF